MSAILYHSSCGKIAFHPHFTRFLLREGPRKARKSPISRIWPSKPHQPSRFAVSADGPAGAAPPSPKCHNGDVSCAICETRKEKRSVQPFTGVFVLNAAASSAKSRLIARATVRTCCRRASTSERTTAENLDPAALFLKVEIGRSVSLRARAPGHGPELCAGPRRRQDRSRRPRRARRHITLARSYERLVESGLHYDEPTQSIAQQAVAGELQNMIKEYREAN